jgi:hypothetical protein
LIQDQFAKGTGAQPIDATPTLSRISRKVMREAMAAKNQQHMAPGRHARPALGLVLR